MAVEIIRKLKRENRILIVVIVALSLIIAGMAVHYNSNMKFKSCYAIENQTADIPKSVDVVKRKTKKGKT